MNHPAIEERFLWIKKDGTEVPLLWQQGAPYRRDRIGWGCPVEIVGYRTYPDMVGGSSVQAMLSAAYLAFVQLLELIDRGEWICYAEEKSERLTHDFFCKIFRFREFEPAAISSAES